MGSNPLRFHGVGTILVGTREGSNGGGTSIVQTSENQTESDPTGPKIKGVNVTMGQMRRKVEYDVRRSGLGKSCSDEQVEVTREF